MGGEQAEPRHDEYLSYSFKELMAEVALKIDRLTASIESVQNRLDSRVSLLERGVPYGQDLVRRFLSMEQAVPVLDRRITVLENRQILVEEMRDSRRWLVGISITTLLGMSGTAIALAAILIRVH